MKQRTTAKPYNRGVHKGERRDPSDYIWPVEFNPWSGLEAEAVGQKFVSPGFSMDAGGMTNDGKPRAPYNPPVRGLPTNAGDVRSEADNPEVMSQLKRLAPPWASSGPGMAVVDRRPG